MNRQDTLIATNKLAECLADEMPPDVAQVLATRLATAVLQGCSDSKSIETAIGFLDELPRLVPPVHLTRMPGIEPFPAAVMQSTKEWQFARREGMVVMFRAFLEKLLGFASPNKHLDLVEQTALGIEFNSHSGQQSAVQGYKEGVIKGKNCLIVFLNYLPAWFRA